MKKKAAFVDYAFHKKTQSAKFLKNLFSKEYDLEEIWIDDWKSQRRTVLDYLNKNNFQTMFFFQFLFSPGDLRRLRCEQIVWFPMYDSEEFTHYSFYVSYLGLPLKIFSFSKKLYHKIKKAGLECYYYQYYPNPFITTGEVKGKRVFFWTRTSDITWDTVKVLLGETKVEKTILQINPDPGYKKSVPTKEDITQYNIKTIEGWLDKKDLFDLLSSCNIFISPRRSEGIGMSFLDAMSQGLCVIAADNSTMNEYIIDAVNGYLYDVKNLKTLNFSDFPAVQKRSQEDLKKGYALWEKEKYNMLVDVNKLNKKINPLKILYLRIIHYPRGVMLVNILKVIRYLKNKLIGNQSFHLKKRWKIY